MCRELPIVNPTTYGSHTPPSLCFPSPSPIGYLFAVHEVKLCGKLGTNARNRIFNSLPIFSIKGGIVLMFRLSIGESPHPYRRFSSVPHFPIKSCQLSIFDNRSNSCISVSNVITSSIIMSSSANLRGGEGDFCIHACISTQGYLKLIRQILRFKYVKYIRRVS